MPDPRATVSRDTAIWGAFTEKPAPRGSKTSLVSCRYCRKHQDVAANSSRMKEHLYKCEGFYNDPDNTNHEIVREIKRRLDGQEQKTVYSRWMQTGSKVQTKLFCPSMSEEERNILDELASLAIYVGGKPLSLYDEEFLRAFIYRLNPAYQIPSRQAFGGALLDRAYESLRELVQEEVDNAYTLNLVTDGSANVNHDRIVNISVQTPMGALYLESLGMDAIKHGGQETADYVATRVATWCNNDITKVNSIATDTENTMRSFIECLHHKPEWKHVFWAPCDSHGLQLLMMHIAELKHGDYKPFAELFKRASNIVGFFHRADKQLKILRNIQKEIYGNVYALTLSVLTRWGTQYRLLHSLTRSRRALQLYATDINTDRIAVSGIIDIIQDAQFWDDLEHLKTIFEPIHKAQIQSESLQSHLGHVYTRWGAIKAHLRGLANNTAFPLHSQVALIFARRPLRNGNLVGKSIWDTQYNKQILPIHLAAYYLDPANLGHGLEDYEQNAVLRFLTDSVVATDEEKRKMRSDFLAFRTRQPPFTRNNPAWEDQSDVKLFWARCSSVSPHLGKLARKIYSTACNSVACERAFSIMKLLHSKARNRTGIEKMDKLQFIYINARVLRYQNKRKRASSPPPDGPNKKPKIVDEPKKESWLELDEVTELAVEEEHLPVPQMTYTQHEEREESDIEIDEQC